MFLKNKNIIFKIRRSKVTEYAALNTVKTLKKTKTWFSRPIITWRQVKSITECFEGSILEYFRASLSYHSSLRPGCCPFLSGLYWLCQVIHQWFIYNFGLMGPGTRCFQDQWVPTANLWVQNTIFNEESAKLLHPGTRWNKNLCAKDAGCAGNKITVHTCVFAYT